MHELNILFIEDNPLDAELLSREIKKGGLGHTSFIIDSLKEVQSLLDEQKFDIIISDYSLPGFTGLDVIDFLNEKDIDVPVILVSGTVPDDAAIDAVLKGAKDYVLKDNLTRLVPAIHREIDAYQAKKEKERNDFFLEALFNSMLGVRISDRNRKIIQVNKKYCEMVGYTENELIGSDLSLVTPEEARETERDIYNDFIRIGRSESEVNKNIEVRKDGSFVDIMSSSTVEKINGEVYVISSIQDISDLLLNKSFLEQTSKSAGVGGWEYHIENDIVKGSPKIFEIFELDDQSDRSAEELIAIYHEDDRQIIRDELQDCIENFSSKNLKLRINGVKGTKKWVRLTFDPYVINGKTVKLYGSLRDITKEKEEEIEREQREQRYRYLFENNPNPLLIIKEDGSNRIIGANSAALNLYGYSKEELLSMTTYQIRPESEIEFYERIIERNNELNLDESINAVRATHQKKNGELIKVDIHWKSISLDQVKGRLILVNDVTEKVKYENELIETNTVLKTLIDSAPIGVFTVDSTGKILDVWNSQCESIFGWTHEEVRGRFLPYAIKENIEDAKEKIDEVFEKGETKLVEINRHTKQAKPITLREYLTPIKDNDGNIEKLMLLIEDISDQKSIENALVNSERKYRNLVEASKDLVWRIDPEGKFNFVNSASKEILGYSPDELTGTSFAPLILPEKIEETLQIHRDVIEGKSFDNFDLTMVKKDGRITYLSAKAYPMRDSEGNIVGCSGTATDITHILEYQQKLEVSLKEKEVLIKEIHHRVKNNLAVISGLFALQAMTMEDEKMIQIFNESQARIKSIATIHEKLYQNNLFTSIEIKSYLKDLLADIKKTFKRTGKEVKIILKGDEVTLNVNQAVPFGILANELITNSFKYAFPGAMNGSITLDVRKNKKEVIFIVQDSGIGLPKDFNEQKKESLGMTLILSLAEQLNGEIKWATKNGAFFELRFIPSEMKTWASKTRLEG
ncbi:MAG: PAS domain S-box protein [Balneolaceae bacterium]|nr:PAS domain S-box protein [Balneolaceae bacterium]MBO6547763.1 PAS domain S-box protein [Balneolaceae bacterium]MBO6648274.1 PAS domain S-box protein [Balneolaceae bacterium]